MREVLLGGLLAALCASGVLLAFSLLHYKSTGPGLPPTRLRPFRREMGLACLRLATWAFLLCALMALPGAASYALLARETSLGGAWVAGLAGIVAAAGYRFLQLLLFNPGLVVASLPCRASRLYPLWQQLSPLRLRLLPGLLGGLLLAWFCLRSGA